MTIIFHRTMSNSTEIIKISYMKRLNFTATGVLILWLTIIIFGIFYIINAFLFTDIDFFWTVSLSNPLLCIVFIMGFVKGKSVSFSIINLIKKRKWKNQSNFIKDILIQLATITIATILTINFYEEFDFTGFFTLFSSFAVYFSFAYFVYCLWYYRYDLPKDQPLRNPNL